MKVKDFIQEWVNLTQDQPPIQIQIQDQVILTPVHITTGSAKIKKCYGWSYSPDCLYYKEQPICYKCLGVICVEEGVTDVIREYFLDLNVPAYTFSNALSDFEDIVHQVIINFIQCATSTDVNYPIEPEVLTFMNKIRVIFDDKYLNYCKGLSVADFNEATTKHKSRKLSNFSRTRRLEGIWYI